MFQEYWEVDDTRKKYTLTILGSEIFRNKKCKWKKHHYSCYDTYDDVVANKPEHLSYQEWAILTRHWETEEHQNREQGAPPTQGDFFKATHISRKTNEPIDELSRHSIDKMTELTGRDEHGAENSITVMPPDRHRRV
ncbi:hypothetical protein FRX31_020251 [Thalictrum thalictroides]|uniref:Uncharacterized protein n=1 Tax=Thalictrum thalictroides TaxID=46969 RepID=A0A7J6W0N4_THATH|nr:hypothetical protein FRX31_020251 [Thalictrum thalictroides]